METLATEILVHILGYLGVKGALMFSMTCTAYYILKIKPIIPHLLLLFEP